MTGLRAWAVVCHDAPAVESLHHTEEEARASAEEDDNHSAYMQTYESLPGCGPHTVVELGPIGEVAKLQEELEAALTLVRALMELECECGVAFPKPEQQDAYRLLRERGRL